MTHRRDAHPITVACGMGTTAAATDSATDHQSNRRNQAMAYVTEKRGVHYAVIYEGRNPVTGRERRRWHRCEDRTDAERVAQALTTDHERRHRAGSSMTLGDYLLGQWLPAREATVARSTHARDGKAVEHYLLPHIGDTPLRRLRAEHDPCQRLRLWRCT